MVSRVFGKTFYHGGELKTRKEVGGRFKKRVYNPNKGLATKTPRTPREIRT
jgi:hypothetical protein